MGVGWGRINGKGSRSIPDPRARGKGLPSPSAMPPLPPSLLLGLLFPFLFFSCLLSESRLWGGCLGTGWLQET